MVDDGEKFGVWPGTYAHVYEDGWLDRFFDRLLSTPWLEADDARGRRRARPGERPRLSARGILPARWGSGRCRPMPRARSRRPRPRSAGWPTASGWPGLLRGGFWRSFLVKYPEVGDTYWKMLRLSRALHGALAQHPDDARLARGQVALWRGQANDAYWHGVFGGCYLPHLRRAVKSSLLDAERSLVEAGAAAEIAWTREDGDGDGRAEVYVRTRSLAVTLDPEAGGMITELGYFPAGLDVADVLARRPEAYHDKVRARAGAAPRTPRTRSTRTPCPKKRGSTRCSRTTGCDAGR